MVYSGLVSTSEQQGQDARRDGSGWSGRIRDKLLEIKELSFREFVAIALYDPDGGYYSGDGNPIGKGADYVTSGALSPVFGFALGRLASEFVRRAGDEVCSIVDIGCGDGSLLRSIAAAMDESVRSRAFFLGIDQNLGRISANGIEGAQMRFSTERGEIPSERMTLLLSNELFDALPFARLVQRESSLNELWVRVNTDGLEWFERPAGPEYQEYFGSREVALVPGQFADVSLQWAELYGELCERVGRGLIVTFDYGFITRKLFDRRIRMYGTAAAYRGHQFNRDLLRDPGEQDLTAHINFSDLIAAGEARGWTTLSLVRQAEFLLKIGILEHPLLRPVEDDALGDLAPALDLLAERESARALVLPEGIGADISVLVQGKRLPMESWGFQKKLW